MADHTPEHTVVSVLNESGAFDNTPTPASIGRPPVRRSRLSSDLSSWRDYDPTKVNPEPWGNDEPVFDPEARPFVPLSPLDASAPSYVEFDPAAEPFNPYSAPATNTFSRHRYPTDREGIRHATIPLVPAYGPIPRSNAGTIYIPSGGQTRRRHYRRYRKTSNRRHRKGRKHHKTSKRRHMKRHTRHH